MQMSRGWNTEYPGSLNQLHEVGNVSLRSLEFMRSSGGGVLKPRRELLGLLLTNAPISMEKGGGWWP